MWNPNRFFRRTWRLTKFIVNVTKVILWWTAPFIVMICGLTFLWHTLVSFMVAMSHEDSFKMALGLFKLGGIGVGAMIGEKITAKMYR